MKRFINKLIFDEGGNLFPLALAVLAVGALITGAFLAAVQTGTLSNDIYSDPIQDRYTADAGVEEAIWDLQYGNLRRTANVTGQTYPYLMAQPLNGCSANVTVTLIEDYGEGIVSYDDFETGSYDGGIGWNTDWICNHGDFSITTDGSPQQGVYHARIGHGLTNVMREVNLAGYGDASMKIWVKCKDFELSYIKCSVSDDGVSWFHLGDTIGTWAFTSNENYRYYDLDLTNVFTDGTLWVRFDALLIPLTIEIFGYVIELTDPYFYFDVIQFAEGLKTYQIESVAGDSKTIAKVVVGGLEPKILSWEIE